MTPGKLALLAGLFAAPAVLLWLGHRYRQQSRGSRRVFWGAVAGHSLGMLVTVAAAHYPPVFWGGGPAWREAAVHWSMLAGALAGAGIGWILARGR